MSVCVGGFSCSGYTDRMTSLEEVPFKSPLGPLQELGPLGGEIELVTAPEFTIPDHLQILQDTEVSYMAMAGYVILFCDNAGRYPRYWGLGLPNGAAV